MPRPGKARFEVWAANLFQRLALRPELITMRLAAREICAAANGRRLELTMGHIIYTQKEKGLHSIMLDAWDDVKTFSTRCQQRVRNRVGL